MSVDESSRVSSRYQTRMLKGERTHAADTCCPRSSGTRTVSRLRSVPLFVPLPLLFSHFDSGLAGGLHRTHLLPVRTRHHARSSSRLALRQVRPSVTSLFRTRLVSGCPTDDMLNSTSAGTATLSRPTPTTSLVIPPSPRPSSIACASRSQDLFVPLPLSPPFPSSPAHPSSSCSCFSSQPPKDAPRGLSCPSALAGLPITSIRDLTLGYDSTSPAPDYLPELESTGGEMITWIAAGPLEGGEVRLVLTIRTSGTEPKVRPRPLVFSLRFIT